MTSVAAAFLELAEHVAKVEAGCLLTRRVLPWHRRSSYEPDAPVLMLRYLGWLLETGIGENGETLHMG
jgi:hypothetical protein